MWPPLETATKAPHLCPCRGENDLVEQEGTQGERKGCGHLGWSAWCLGEGRSHTPSGGSGGRILPPTSQLLGVAHSCLCSQVHMASPLFLPLLRTFIIRSRDHPNPEWSPLRSWTLLNLQRPVFQIRSHPQVAISFGGYHSARCRLRK